MPSKLTDALPGDKLLALYQRLTLHNGRHFQTEIAGALGCSAQAVPRMVAIIERHLGKDSYIEYGIENRRRYYRICSKAESRTLSFLSEDLHGIALCCDIASLHLPKHVAERMKQSFAQIALHMGDSGGSAKVGAVIGFGGKGYIDYGPHLGIIEAVRKAIGGKNICDVLYMAAGRKTEAKYRYAPGRIVAMNGALYVQGYKLVEGSLLQDRPTTFSLHRINTITPTGEYFAFNAADLVACRFGLDWHQPKRMQIRIAQDAAEYVRDRIWSDEQSIRELENGDIVLTMTTTSEKEVRAWVGSFCGLASVLNEPAESGYSSQTLLHSGSGACDERAVG